MNNIEEKDEMIQENDKSMESILVMNSDEEESQESEDHNIPLIDGAVKCKKKSKSDDNMTPVSIGKIIIFKPRQKSKKSLFRKCFTYIFCCLIFLFAINYLIKLISHLPSNTHRHDKSACDHVIPTFVWNYTFPMLTIESPLRLVDVNNDSVLDVIVSFGTGVDSPFYRSLLCQIYFNQSETDKRGCGGGMMALDGKSGKTIWSRYTPRELFAPNCNLDINRDGIKDCIVGGKMSLHAFNGANGSSIWTIPISVDEVNAESSLNFYTPLYIPNDIDGDDVPDIVVMQGGSQPGRALINERTPARLLVISAKNGEILSGPNLVPDEAESHYGPQLLTRPDGTLLILFGTGDETHGGSLYFIALNDLLQGKMNKANYIYTDCCKGVMVPPVLVDINGDQVQDIIMSLFNSTVVAFDGLTFEILWKKDFPGGETLSAPSVGFFNNDSIPDFAITYNYGPGKSVYDRSEFTILNGKDGNQLIDKPIKMLIGTQSSPLSISTFSNNDIFVHWFSSCTNISSNSSAANGKESKQLKFLPHTSGGEIKHTDLCKLRFKDSSMFNQLRVTTPTSTSIIFDSRDHKQDELYVNYTAMGETWINSRLKLDDYGTSSNDNSDGQYTPPAYQSDQQSDNTYPQYDQLGAYPYGRLKYQPNNRRYKRQTANKMHPGVLNVASTGTLIPSLSAEENTIGLIFATYWFPSPSKSNLMTPEMDSCITRYMSSNEIRRLRSEGSNSLFKQLRYDPNAYEEAVKDVCLRETNQEDPRKSEQNGLIREMGFMTIYRVNLQCISSLKGSNKMARIKRYKDQLWPSYMGINGDCIANVKNI